MWIFIQIKYKYYDFKAFFSNIKWYKRFLWEDRKWENDSILTFLRLKLQKTVEYYNKGLDLPYVGWEEDKEKIQHAYNLIVKIDNGITDIENELTAGEVQELQNELFDILKQCRNWWD